MRYTTGYRTRSFYTSGYFPPGVKWLLISNIAVFVLSYLARGTELGQIFRFLALTPAAVVHNLQVYQLVTYLFLHGGFWHLIVNMFTLWMFGAGLEQDWGTRRFLKYYFLCGIGAGICDVTVNALIGNWGTSTIGASGAIYGLLLAFGVMYPNQVILMSFLFPIKAKYFVMIYGAIALLSSLNVNSGVSDIAHLGGMLFGLIYLKAKLPKFQMGDLTGRYRRWQMQRAKKKFQVYMRKQQRGDRDRWVN
jgi:membrane associated rhomboid family serine protease